jgi:nicotinamidase-related amidase
MASIEAFEDHCWQDVLSAEDLRIYRPYARETGVGPSAALLAIDLYECVYRGGAHPPSELVDQHASSCGIFAHQAIEPTQRLFAAARRAKIPIFFCTGETRPNTRPIGSVATKRRRAPQPDDYDIRPEFAPQPSDVVIYKQRASAFEGSPLCSHLQLLGVQSLIVCGEATSGCVRASVVDAYSSGFNVAVVEECTFDQTVLTHKINLFDMHHKYADVLHLDEVLAHLASLAETDR